MKDLSKIQGCLLAGAAGDALGYAIEFIDENMIFERYGKDGIQAYKLVKGKALISDDTQMTLFTAVALSQGEDYLNQIRHAYQDWYRTQYEGSELWKEPGFTWLFNHKEMHDSRAPGITCLTAIRGGCQGTIEEPCNESKGCGGVMRVAPIGLFFEDEDVGLLAAKASALTHGHRLGYIPSAMLAYLVQIISHQSMDLREAVRLSLEKTKELFSNTYMKDFEELIELAMDLTLNEDASDLDCIHQIGEGWVAEEALGIAIYCALKYSNDLEKALIVSVNHRGDSDSTGAITGNILGAYLGVEGIPEKFLTHLELKDIILEVADELYKNGR